MTGTVGDAADDAAAITLIDGVRDLEVAVLTSMLRPGVTLSDIAWDSVPAQVMLPAWKKEAEKMSTLDTGATVASLPDLVARAPEIGRLYAPADSPIPSGAVGLAVLSHILAVALCEHGWTMTAMPGDPVTCTRELACIQTFDVLMSLGNGDLTADAWRKQAVELGIDGLKLTRSIPAAA